jgi:hypothetical protein
MFAQDPNTESLQDAVYEAIDSAKSDLHRTNVMWQSSAICLVCWGLFWGMISSGVVTVLIIRFRTFGYVVRGIIISLAITAYLTAALAVSIFAVTTFSLAIWHTRYRNLDSVDADYINAKSQFRRARMWWVIVGIVVVLPALLSILFPRIRFIVNPFTVAF